MMVGTINGNDIYFYKIIVKAFKSLLPGILYYPEE